MIQELQKPNILERDEQIIDDVIKNYELIAEDSDDEKVHSFILSQLEPLYHHTPLITTLTGAPASGKDTLVQSLTKILTKKNHPTGSMDTDGFGKDTRINRNNKIKEGASPVDVKDFELAKEIIKKVRQGGAVKVPVYHEETGEALIAPQESWNQLPSDLHFLIFSGDFQPLDDPDYRIYLHVSTNIRRENRLKRDLEKRKGYGDAAAIVKSFDDRLESQYYPFTLPQAAKSDLLIIATPENLNEPADKEKNKYSYKVYKRKQFDKK